MTIPKIIHQTSKSGSITWEERVLARRACRLLDGWEYRLWSDAALSELMRSVFGSFAHQFDRITRGIVRADIGRYAFLYANGGLYLDTDYKLVASIATDDHVECLLPVEEGEVGAAGIKLGNAVLASSKGHPFWKDLIEHIFTTDPWALNNGNPVATSGPIALTNFWLVNGHRYSGIETPKKNCFYPRFAKRNFSYAGDSSTCGVHLCWGSWRGKTGLTAARNLVRRKATCLYG